MKKQLSELTTLQRHWLLAECLGIKVSNLRVGVLYLDEATELTVWNPDTDKALMWDLLMELGGLYFEYEPAIVGDEDNVINAENVQLVYILHKLGSTVEVPEGLE